MNYTQTYKKMIIEAEETFAKYIPDSEEILKSIKIVVCSSDSVEKEVMKFCKKFNAQYRDFDLTDQIILGKTVNGEGEYGIVLNEEADDDEGTMYMTMWHEIAHCYAWEKDGVTCNIMDFPMPFRNDFEKKLRDRWNQTMGYDFWKEFVAENIAYYLMQMTGKYEDYIKVIDSLDTMLETCLNEIDTSITADRDQDQYLYKFFSLLFAERRDEMMKEHIDLSMVNDPEVEYHLKGDIIMEAGMAWIDDGPKETLAELFEILYEQMNKKEFWVADNKFLIRVGEARRNFLDSLKELQENEDCSDEDF